MHDTFGRVAVINLDRRPERWERFNAGLPAAWPFAPPTRFPATDSRAVSPPSGWLSVPGAFGCWDSHCRLLESIDPAGEAPVLILEDDALLAPDFPGLAAAFLSAATAFDPGWEMIFLGGEHASPPPRSVPPPVVAPGVVRCRWTVRNHCYAVRPAFAPTLAAHWRANLDAIDATLWPWAAFRRVYAPTRWLAGQAAGQSDITPARHRNRWFGPTP